MLILWIVVMVVGVLVEAATLTLISIWFAVGALGAAIAELLGASVTVQLIIFVVLSALMIAVTRPLLKKIMPAKYTPTNSELDVGKQAVVIENIDNNRNEGRVRLDGVDWNAVSDDGSVIKKDTVVIVKEVGTTKLTVASKQNDN